MKSFLNHCLKHKGLLGQGIIVLIIIGFISAGIIAIWIVTLDIPSFDQFEERLVTQSTKIYDRTGKILLYNVHDTVRRKVVSGDDISRHIKNATVAIEDNEFYEHFGIKPMAILRSVFVNILAGGYAQGGSTITQQLIKNSLLTQEKKISRKIKEWLLAIKIEKVMTKEEILNLYLNESPYGGNLYGVEEAAESFFGKQAKDVTLAQSAYLAAIPKAPTFYSPYGNNREKLEERKSLVLRRMRELNFITDEELKQASEEKVTFSPPEDRGIKAPHFALWVRDYLEEKYGEEALVNDGLKVITTIDWELQQKAEEIVKKYGEENRTKFNAKNASMVAIDPKTGEILVMVGSVNYFDTANEGNFNVALSHRQPGSSFKPIVYATAFNEGYTPETVVFDLETQFDTNCEDDKSKCYTPQNYDNLFRGPISLRNALAQSINIPALKTLYLVGIRDALKTAQVLGITSLTNVNNYGLPLVLGGGEVSPLELTSAYSVFANDGVRNPYEKILSVETSSGQVLEKFTPRPQTALPANTARLISDVLSDNVARTPAFGANSVLNFPGRQVAAKTGTTNDYRDAWVVGYTPSIAIGAWVGNNDNTPMEKKVAGFIVAPMWNAVMKEALKKFPIENFKKPEPTSNELKPVLRGFWQGGISYNIDKISGKLATEYTPASMQEERVIKQVHSILYWLDKDNPNGPAPRNPESDQQFKLWEEPVKAWAKRQGIKEETENDLPKEYDNIHTAANQPEIKILSPNSNGNYRKGETLNLKLDIDAKFAIDRVDLFLNQNYLQTVRRAPFEASFVLSEDLLTTSGKQELRVVVYDNIGNTGEDKVRFDLTN